MFTPRISRDFQFFLRPWEISGKVEEASRGPFICIFAKINRSLACGTFQALWNSCSAEHNVGRVFGPNRVVRTESFFRVAGYLALSVVLLTDIKGFDIPTYSYQPQHIGMTAWSHDTSFVEEDLLRAFVSSFFASLHSYLRTIKKKSEGSPR